MSFNKIEAIKVAREFNELSRQNWSLRFFELGSKLCQLGISADALREFCYTSGSLKDSKDFIERELGGFLIEGREMYETEFNHISSRETFEEAMKLLKDPMHWIYREYHEYRVTERATDKKWYVTTVNS